MFKNYYHILDAKKENYSILREGKPMPKLIAYIGCFAFIIGASMVPDTTSAFVTQVTLLYGGLITAVWAGIASR